MTPRRSVFWSLHDGVDVGCVEGVERWVVRIERKGCRLYRVKFEGGQKNCYTSGVFDTVPLAKREAEDLTRGE